MEITVSQSTGRVPVTVLQTHGPVDGSNYEELIEKGKIAIEAGVKDILLDLGDTDYMSTAGMVAIQTITRLLRGETPPPDQSGWDAIHHLDPEGGKGEPHLKLLNPQPRVEKSLEAIGFMSYFQVFRDKDEAIKAF
jgi:anti-anti-sigma regulatory factor